MYFSRAFKSSAHCLSSPDGVLIATLLSKSITFTSVETLQTVNIVSLPSDFSSASVVAFTWSDSSRRVLVASQDQIHVYSAQDSRYHAIILNHSLATIKPSCVRFGAHDNQVCVWSGFGLKLAVFDIASSKTFEIANPKFFTLSTVPLGFAVRARTSHIALLTRVSGKDTISIHNPTTLEVQASWQPDVTDAQALQWTPDGCWIVVTESPAHGRKVLFYTPDGNLFRQWPALATKISTSHNINDEVDDDDFDDDSTDNHNNDSTGGNGDANHTDNHRITSHMAAGVKRCVLSPDSQLAAMCDHTRSVCIVHLSQGSNLLRLIHPTTVEPKDTVQVWQQQISISTAGIAVHSFVKATQPVMAKSQGVESKPGCSAAYFDASSGLVASKMEDSEGTLWIWDIKAHELRAVMLFHSPVTTMKWHPHVRETLLIVCQGDTHKNVIFVWDPLSNGPTPIYFADHLPQLKTTTKIHASWLNIGPEAPGLLLGNSIHHTFCSLAASDDMPQQWTTNNHHESQTDSAAQIMDRSLVMAGEQSENDVSTLDDTFYFKKDPA